MNTLVFVITLFLSSVICSKSSRLDCKIDPLADSELINIFANFQDQNQLTAFRNDLVNVPKFFHAKWMKATAELDAQIQGIREILTVAPFSDYEFQYGPGYYASRIMMNAKEEWDIRKEVFKPIFIETLNLLKNARDEAVTKFDFYCGECPSRDNMFCSEYAKTIKKWTVAHQMFGAEDIEDWIKPDWKPVIQSLQGSFAIAPVGEDLNFYFHLKSVINAGTSGTGGKNIVQLASDNFNAHFNEVRSRIPKTEPELMEDFDLRASVVSAILQKAQDDINLDVIYNRAKAFERMAEGIARFKEKELLFNTGNDNIQVGRAVKAWLMAKQMFTERGYEDADVVQYARLAGVNLVMIAYSENNHPYAYIEEINEEQVKEAADTEVKHETINKRKQRSKSLVSWFTHK